MNTLTNLKVNEKLISSDLVKGIFISVAGAIRIISLKRVKLILECFYNENLNSVKSIFRENIWNEMKFLWITRKRIQIMVYVVVQKLQG